MRIFAAVLLLGIVYSLPVQERNVLDDVKKALEGLLKQAEQKALTDLLPALEQKALSAGLQGLTSLLGKRDVNTLLELLKQEANTVLSKVEGAGNAVKTVTQGLEHLLKDVTGTTDILGSAQKVANFLTTSLHNLQRDGHFEVNVNQLVDSILPQALVKLLHPTNKRFLIGDFADVAGLFGSVVHSGEDKLLSLFDAVKSKLQPTLDNVKALASNFLSQEAQLTAETAAKAVQFFKPFASVLGPVFAEIQTVAAKFIPTPSA